MQPLFVEIYKKKNDFLTTSKTKSCEITMKQLCTKTQKGFRDVTRKLWYFWRAQRNSNPRPSDP